MAINRDVLKSDGKVLTVDEEVLKGNEKAIKDNEKALKGNEEAYYREMRRRYGPQEALQSHRGPYKMRERHYGAMERH